MEKTFPVIDLAATGENIARLRDIGIDYVSSGALTHSAPILDLSMKHLRPLTAEEA